MAVRAPVAITLLVVGEDATLVESGFQAAEDSPVDVAVETVTPEAAAARAALTDGDPDAIVVGPVATGEAVSDVVAALRSVDESVPIVGIVEDATGATAALDAGATDYVLRSVATERPGLVAARVRRAVDEAIETGLPGSPGWYDALLQHSMDALTVLDADGTITYQNPSVERLLGYEPEALVGRDSLEYVHEDDRERVRETFERLFERGSGASEEIRFRFRHADGSWEWFESVATARQDAGIDGYVVNSRLITERKEREREVERYETLLDVLPDTVVITDVEGTIVEIYGEEGWSGYDRDELLDGHVETVLPADSIERGTEIVGELLQADDREKATFETKSLTKDGEVIPFENHLTTLPADDDGRVSQVMHVLRNVADRKERERELEQAETVFQNVRDGVFLMDVTDQGRFEYQRANAAYESITGFTEADIRGETPRSVIPDADVAATVEADMTAAVENRSPRHNVRELEFAGEARYLETWFVPVVVDDEVDSLVGVLRDVTERRERQRELELKTQAMDEAPIAISLVEPDGTDVPIVYVNEGFEDLTGYEESEIIGEDWRILGGKETDPETAEAFREALVDRTAMSTEMLYYRQDGSPRWAQATVAPIRNADGELTHFVGFHQDITDLKEYETEIERRFDEFADLFADDLREPLEAAQTALEAARVNGDEDALEEATEWIERADSLLADLATVHSFSVPSRDHSESARLDAVDGE